MKCPPEEKIQSLLLGELPKQEAEKIIEHLKACKTCLDIARTIGTIVRVIRDTPPPAELIPELIEVPTDQIIYRIVKNVREKLGIPPKKEEV